MRQAQPTNHDWCHQDQHQDFSLFDDFNEWIDQGNTFETGLLPKLSEVGLSQTSKAFYAGDREAYLQAFNAYRIERRHAVLGKEYFTETYGAENGQHWFERNEAHFDALVARLADAMVVPFIGAGVSAGAGFPTWANHLRQQGRTAGLKPEQIEEWIAAGDYEQIITHIETKHGAEVFAQEIRDVFGKTGSIQDITLLISELFTDTLITTNYDRLLEQVFDTGREHKVQVINGMTALEKPYPDKVTIIKLHGDIQKPKRCILGKTQYDEAYGANGVDLTKPIPKLLQYYFKNNSFLFIGCSLNNDRTVDVFTKIKAEAGDFDFPEHFAIEQIPETLDELVKRNSEFAQIGITAIWFPKEAFEYINDILSLAKNELQYMQASDNRNQETEIPSDDALEALQDGTTNTEIDLSTFLHDFIDLMPLLYWINQSVPQEHTDKYLRAMQCVFHASSLFTNGTDRNLLWGLDNLLRAISNQPNFDGYSAGKLSVAFEEFQKVLLDLGEPNHYKDSFEWNVHEMLTIPRSQFEDILDRFEPKDPNHLAIRLAIALLGHGKSQSVNPKAFCKLPESVNAELQAYLSLALLEKLEVKTPDRLDEMFTNDVADLCESAWENFDKPMPLGLLESIKINLFGIFSR
ncbi:SIR2 family protein [Methylotenera sp.]|uniref:SIR2 family NAD-dependent protein deacylase n=1 Tax=Methylotenera sp. TaxID=2051956 RepID=UPI002734B8C8|nr:SIR2 family protein [Methylotenera sp.]MDP3777952.1 SIR2 family protein [Methylotenera sp.]